MNTQESIRSTAWSLLASSAPPARPRARRKLSQLRDQLYLGQTWIHETDGTEWQVVQHWRVDRRVRLRRGEHFMSVPYTVLAHEWVPAIK